MKDGYKMDLSKPLGFQSMLDNKFEAKKSSQFNQSHLSKGNQSNPLKIGNHSNPVQKIGLQQDVCKPVN